MLFAVKYYTPTLVLLLSVCCSLVQSGTVAPAPETTTVTTTGPGPSLGYPAHQQESLYDMIEMSDIVVWGNVTDVITGDMNTAHVTVYCTLIGPMQDDNITITDAIAVCTAPDECQFPFMYDDVIYQSCTSVDNDGEYWCSHDTHHISMIDQWSPCHCPVCNKTIHCYISDLVVGQEYVFYLIGMTSLQTLYKPVPINDHRYLSKIARSCSYVGYQNHREKACPPADWSSNDCDLSLDASTFTQASTSDLPPATTAWDTDLTSHATYAYKLGGEGVAGVAEQRHGNETLIVIHHNDVINVSDINDVLLINNDASIIETQETNDCGLGFDYGCLRCNSSSWKECNQTAEVRICGKPSSDKVCMMYVMTSVATGNVTKVSIYCTSRESAESKQRLEHKNDVTVERSLSNLTCLPIEPVGIP